MAIKIISRTAPLGRMALEFDGADDYVDLGTKLQIPGDQTIEMWIQPGNFDEQRSPYAKMDSGEGSIAVNTDATVTYYYGNSTELGQFQEFNTTTKLPANMWSHLAAVRDLENKKLYWYINGEVESAEAQYDEPMAAEGSTFIGQGFMNNFLGQIDEVRIWNVARSGEQIEANMDATLAGDEEGLVGYWRFNEGYGDIAFDETSNGNNGQLGGGNAANKPQWVVSTTPAGLRTTAEQSLVKLSYGQPKPLIWTIPILSKSAKPVEIETTAQEKPVPGP